MLSRIALWHARSCITSEKLYLACDNSLVRLLSYLMCYSFIHDLVNIHGVAAETTVILAGDSLLLSLCSDVIIL